MTKPDCEICRGAGMIRLPIYRRVRADYFASADMPAIAEESSRSYPCPECSDSIPQERLAVVQYHSLVDSRVSDPEFVRHAKDSAANNIGAGLLKGGFIRFERGPNDARKYQFPLRATVGVVSLTQVAALEQRIAERQEDLAREVVSDASRSIHTWHGTLQKGYAVRLVNESLTRVLAKRSSWKAA